MEKISRLLEKNPAFQALIKQNQDIIVNSINSEALLVASAFLSLKKNIVIIKENQYEANQLYDKVKPLVHQTVIFSSDESFRIEALASSPELLEKRVNCLYELTKDEPHIIIGHVHSLIRYVPSLQLFKDNILHIKKGDVIDLLDLQKQLVSMGYQHSKRVDSPMYFSKRGGVIDVYSCQYDNPIRIEFFDDEVDFIKFYNPKTQRTYETIDEVSIIPASDLLYLDEEIGTVTSQITDLMEASLDNLNDDQRDSLVSKVTLDIENLKNHSHDSSLYSYFYLFQHTGSFIDYVKSPLVILSNKDRIDFQYKNFTAENFFYYQELSQIGKFVSGLQLYSNPYEVLSNHYICFDELSKGKDEVVFHCRDLLFNHDKEDIVIQELKDALKTSKVLISLQDQHQVKLICEMLDRHEMTYSLVGISNELQPGINIYVGIFQFGFELVEEEVTVISSHDLFGQVVVKKPKYFKYKDARVIKDYQELNVGDYVVHDSYGIGQYLGIKTLEVKGFHKDYLYVSYAGDDTLYIPVEQFKLIRKYSSVEGKAPKVHKLGSSQWAKTKQNAKNKIDDIADKLIEIYAKRMSSEGYAFASDSDLQIDFESHFDYELTYDQQRSLDEIKEDMEKIQPMDRLLCGDVGFGKTEVALRAAFKAIVSNKQVAFLCPTTILSMQHYQTVEERFKGFPVTYALLNRFTSSKEKKRILSGLKDGSIDFVIGTHRILSKDVVFKDIGFLIIDEEQRFGVRQKEKIKEYRESIDVLSLSATPIPRTLQMSLMGIRGLSQIETPPKDRLPVQTYVIEKNNILVKQVIERELARDGQVFYLHNRTDNIENTAYTIASSIKNARVTVGHGKMDKNELEDVMMRFNNHEFNVLVCTTIIETGIDIPNANTILVEDADRFGLSQLYQIRGRVGRSNRAAYAYLLYNGKKVLNDEARKRLKAIKEFTELGSGYKIAMRDLSIRGSGDILGGKQAGFIDSVGFETYMQILQEAIRQRKQLPEEKEEMIENVNVNVDGYIPENYVDSDYEKLELYQKIEKATSLKQLSALYEEFEDFYGQLPPQVSTLLEKRRLDILSHNPMIESLQDLQNTIQITFTKEATSSIKGDLLFEDANRLFTKPSFKAIEGKIAITVNKGEHWLKRLNELLLDIKKNAYQK